MIVAVKTKKDEGKWWAWPCPNCHTILDDYTCVIGIDQNTRPKPEDVTACAKCGVWLLYLYTSFGFALELQAPKVNSSLRKSIDKALGKKTWLHRPRSFASKPRAFKR